MDSENDDYELDDIQMWKNLAIKSEVAVNNKRRRMSVCQLKQMKSQMKGKMENYPKYSNIKSIWKSIAKRTLMLKDPFRKFNITELPTLKATRYQYDSTNRKWSTDLIFLKMETESFNSGAMRECFRVKKIPTYHEYKNSPDDWKHAHNYVGKRYMEDVSRFVYFEDVRLQMDAKLWSEMFNQQTGVKKKVDIVKMCVIELLDDPSKPLYHLENFIEGNYIKYNSNSGFVEDSILRNTPQAFSHFTFEKSGHELIVVDIQGVGDLYTDPQIHTACQTGYGDGNLGCRGMALFFHSHCCNTVCQSLCLARFDLSGSEVRVQPTIFSSVNQSTTAAMGVSKPSTRQSLRSLRSSDPSSELENALISILDDSVDSTGFIESLTELEAATHGSVSVLGTQVSSPDSGMDNGDNERESVGQNGHDSTTVHKEQKHFRRARFQHDSGISDDLKKDHDSVVSFSQRHKHRPSCASFALLHGEEKGESILGKIHHEMAHMHEAGRFLDKTATTAVPLGCQDIDWEAVVFHEEMAARLNYRESLINMAHFYLELPLAASVELLDRCPLKPSHFVASEEDKRSRGWIYLTKAADSGHLGSAMILVDGSDVGGPGGSTGADWCTVAHWLKRAISCLEDEAANAQHNQDNSGYVCTWVLKARLAAMFRAGKYGLERDLERAYELYSEAADEATASMKGRLAAKYYELMEEVSAEMEEQPEE